MMMYFPFYVPVYMSKVNPYSYSSAQFKTNQLNMYYRQVKHAKYCRLSEYKFTWLYLNTRN